MKKTALALASALLLLAACDSASDQGNGAGGNGAAGANGAQVIGKTASGEDVTDRVFFALDSSVIESEGQGVLSRQAEWLKANSSVKVTIEGHADERGTREYNIALGERRATAAKNYLVSQGVDAGRVSTVSYGKERPAVVGNEEGSWAQNRRAVTVTAN